MTLENSINETIIGDFLNFNRSIAEMPAKISVPHEVKMDTCEYDIVYEEDRIRMLHYKPLTEKQINTPLVISYAIVNRYHIFDIDPKKSKDYHITKTFFNLLEKQVYRDPTQYLWSHNRFKNIIDNYNMKIPLKQIVNVDSQIVLRKRVVVNQQQFFQIV